MPRAFPSAYGQTVGGSLSCKRRDLSGAADAPVGTPRTMEPLAGGKAYRSPCERNSIRPDRFTRFSRPATASNPASAQRFKPFDTSEGEMDRLSARFFDLGGSSAIASLRRIAISCPCICSFWALISNLEIGNFPSPIECCLGYVH